MTSVTVSRRLPAMLTRIHKRGRTYLVFLDSQGEPLPITPRAWRHSIFRLDPHGRDNRSNWRRPADREEALSRIRPTLRLQESALFSG